VGERKTSRIGNDGSTAGVSTEACFKFLKLIKAGEKIEGLSTMPKDKEWVSLYRNHRMIQRSAIESLRRFG
jgi:hypothetical protein